MRNLFLFVTVTFAWSWGFWSIPLLAVQGVDLPVFLQRFTAQGVNPAPWGPLVGAIVAALARGGLPALGRLLGRGLRLRFGWRWYLVIFLTFPVLIGGSIVLGRLAGDPWPQMDALKQPAILPIAFLCILFLGGPLQEEFGWRGTLLDSLQGRFGAFAASLIVGTVWALWHLPLFRLPEMGGLYYDRPFWGLLLSTLLVSVLFTWVYNNTGGSVAAAMLFHAMFNFSHYIFNILSLDRAALILFAVQTVLVVWVVARFGAAELKAHPATA